MIKLDSFYGLRMAQHIQINHMVNPYVIHHISKKKDKN